MEITTERQETFRSEPHLLIEGDTWRVDLSHYAPLIREVTAVSVEGDPSVPDCYRIGNRLQGFISDRGGRGEWDSVNLDGYPVVDSMEEVFWLAEFFRECHRRED